MNCFIQKLSNYDFKGLYQCLPEMHTIRSYLPTLTPYMPNLRPYVVSFCKSFQEPISCPPTNCTKCFEEKTVEDITTYCLNIEKKHYIGAAIAIGFLAIPTIAYIGKKLMGCFRSNNTSSIQKTTEIATLVTDTRSQEYSRPLPAEYQIQYIPNIISRTKQDVLNETQGLSIHFEVEKGSKLKVSINCINLTPNIFEHILKELSEKYPQTEHIEFYNLTKGFENIFSKLSKYSKISALTFTNCTNLRKKHIDFLCQHIPSVKRYIFKETDIEKLDEIETHKLITYSDKTSNLEEKTVYFINDIHSLEDPDAYRTRTPSVTAGGEPSKTPSLQKKELTNEDIKTFISSLKTKDYYPIFLSPDLFLDLSQIENLDDKFLIELFKFLKENDLYISGLDVSSNNLNGSFLEYGKGLGIKTLILSNLQKFDFDNLKFLNDYPKLKNLDLSNLGIRDEHLLYLNPLKTLKVLILNRCQHLSKNSLKTFILSKLHSLEFLSIEDCKIEDRDAQEILEHPLNSSLILVHNNNRDDRTVYIKNLNSIRKALFHHLVRITKDIHKLQFIGHTTLYLDDIVKLSNIPSFEKLKELDLSHVKVEDFAFDIDFEKRRKSYCFREEIGSVTDISHQKYKEKHPFARFNK